MESAVKHFVRYETPDENKETRRQRNVRFKQGHRTPDEPEIPLEAEHVWEWFWTLSGRRRKGPELLSYMEVGEWSRLTGTAINPEEVELIMNMDSAWMKETSSELEAFHQRQSAHNQRAQPAKETKQ